MLGEANPLAEWEEVFDGADTSEDISQYPPFDEVLAKCREVRESTMALVDSLSEDDLDKVSQRRLTALKILSAPIAFACNMSPTTGTCIADTWPMHGGPLE